MCPEMHVRGTGGSRCQDNKKEQRGQSQRGRPDDPQSLLNQPLNRDWTPEEMAKMDPDDPEIRSTNRTTDRPRPGWTTVTEISKDGQADTAAAPVIVLV